MPIQKHHPLTLTRPHLCVILTLLGVALLTASGALAQLAFGLGGTSGDQGRALALDTAGNVYLTGFFNGTVDFDPGPGVFELSTGLVESAYVASYDAAGTLRYALSFPGEGNGIGVDTDGHVFVTGLVGSGVVDVDPGPDQVLLNRAEGKVFLVSYDSAGNLRFGFNVGGGISNKVEEGRALALDAAGNVYVTGVFNDECDFDPTDGEKTVLFEGITDGFLASYSNEGNVRFAFGIGGKFSDEGTGLDVDPAGNSTVVGAFRDTLDFDPGPNVENLVPNGQRDWYLAGYTATGDYRFAIGIGGTSDELATAVAQDEFGNSFVTGWFRGEADFDPGPLQNLLMPVGQEACFLASYTDTGDLRFAFRLGNAQPMKGFGVDVDPDGHPTITGSFNNLIDFDPGPGDGTIDGSNDAFLASYTSAGDFRYALHFPDVGPENSDVGEGIVIDGSYGVHVTGTFAATVDLDPGPGLIETTANGSGDAFYSLSYPAVSNAEILPLAKPGTNLLPAFPNPFNPGTTIAFELKSAGVARVGIYDVRGTLVRSLLSEVRSAGRHEVVWNGQDDRGRSAASGTYLVMLRSAGVQDSQRIMLLK